MKIDSKLVVRALYNDTAMTSAEIRKLVSEVCIAQLRDDLELRMAREEHRLINQITEQLRQLDQ